MSAPQAVRLRGRDRSGPVLAASAASPLSRADSPTSRTRTAIAALGEKPRRDKTVAAVVAGPGHDHDAAAGGLSAGDRLGDRPAGILHQLDAGDAAGDGQPVGLRHFGIGEQFDHAVGNRIAECGRLANIALPIAHDAHVSID